MSRTPASHRDVIYLLGGPTALARSLALTPVNTTNHWGTRGIPRAHRQRIAELAAEHDVTIQAADWDTLRLTPARRLVCVEA